MNFGVVLIAVGGFLLGGAYSVAKLDSDGAGKRRGQYIVAAVLLVFAVYLVVAGILQVGQE